MTNPRRVSLWKKAVKTRLATINPLSVFLLKTGLPLILFQLVAIAILAEEALRTDPVFSYTYYSHTLESVAVSLTLLIGGAVIFDIQAKRK